ncbi:Folylpolyglutamate synthetase [Sporothrix bragantina]|uniref:Folylpolyglutamate synthetase n=1 Tax=Sporothrix bragantina TaxID=671064 RepID=A0ABP0BQ35_9PEZI
MKAASSSTIATSKGGHYADDDDSKDLDVEKSSLSSPNSPMVAASQVKAQATMANTAVAVAAGLPSGPPVSGQPSAGPPNFRKLFVKKLSMSAVFISICFWIVDYDGAAVGQALLTAVAATSSAGQLATNPVYRVVSADDYTAEDVQRAVFKGYYWGAIYATAGATANFEAAVKATSNVTSDALSTTVAEYDPAGAYMLVGNSARYAAFYPTVVLSNLEAVAADARLSFLQTTVADYLLNASNSGTATTTQTLTAAQMAVALDPVGYTIVDTSYGSFTFGDRAVFNTLLIVVVVLNQFFFLMSLNSLAMAFGRYKNVRKTEYFRWRLGLSVGWTFLCSLFLTAWQLIFIESYPVTAGMFFALWTLYFAFSLIVFDVFDTAMAFVPAPYFSFFMFTWMITNVTSAGCPIELSSFFYRVSWFFPAHAMWLAEQHIYSQGGAYPLTDSLPILAAWLVVAKLCTLLTYAPRRKAAAEAASGGGHGGTRGGARGERGGRGG